MNLTDVGPTKYIKFAECKPGDILVEGTYIKTREGTYGNVHHFRNKDGQEIGMNKAGMLCKFVEDSLWEGRACRITYTGKQEIENGMYKGKEAHTFKFAIDLDEKKPMQQMEMKLEEDSTADSDLV